MTRFTELLNVEQIFNGAVNGAVNVAPRILAAILVTFLLWGVYRVTRRSLNLVLTKAGAQEFLVRLIVDDVCRIVFLVFAIVMAADQLGFDVGAALAGIGIAGIAIGFAAQDSLANVIAGFLIFLDKPFHVGDWVRVADQYGEVREVTIRSTRIKTPQNTYVVIPNKQIIDQVLVNHSKHGETRVDVPLGIAYKELIPRARTVLLDAVQHIDLLCNDPSPDVVVKALGSSSVDLEVRVWIDKAADERAAFYAVMESCKLALDAAGIQIPYHHLQLFVDDVEDRVWQKMGSLMRGGR